MVAESETRLANVEELVLNSGEKGTFARVLGSERMEGHLADVLLKSCCASRDHGASRA